MKELCLNVFVVIMAFGFTLLVLSLLFDKLGLVVKIVGEKERWGLFFFIYFVVVVVGFIGASAIIASIVGLQI